MDKGTLYIVATPIGNLGDITLRALETLKSVDLIACEDTRVTGVLLKRYDIKKPMMPFHQHSSEKVIGELVDRLNRGENIALVTDSGTPGISDPGGILVGRIRRVNVHHPKQREGSSNANKLPSGLEPVLILSKDSSLGAQNDVKEKTQNDLIKIIPIPGPSAVAAAVSVSGIVEKEYYFAGFLPKKKGRQTQFKRLVIIKVPIVIYESALRLERTLGDIKTYFGEKAEVFIAREISKMFEEYWGGNINFVISDLKNHQLKGELVLVVR
jgi:16S rRNA (cytidine1402-2'-O)-methyltransferase